MAQRANGSLRDATKNVADHSDGLDAGWEEAPATPATSSSVPPPLTTSPPSAGIAPKVSEIRALSSVTQTELPGPSKFEIPDFRRYEVGPTPIVAAIGAVVALIVASVASPQFPTVVEHSSEVAVTQLPRAPLAQPLPKLQSPEPPRAVTTPATPSASALQIPAETAHDEPIVVTVKVIPENSVIFRGSEKLGFGAVEVSVEHDAKQRLTALHDGYVPYSFTLDGSRDTVTVRLHAVPKPETTATYVSDSPFQRTEAP